MSLNFYEDVFDPRRHTRNLSLAVVKLKPEKNSGRNGIQTHDLWDISAVLIGISEVMGSNPIQT